MCKVLGAQNQDKQTSDSKQRIGNGHLLAYKQHKHRNMAQLMDVARTTVFFLETLDRDSQECSSSFFVMFCTFLVFRCRMGLIAFESNHPAYPNQTFHSFCQEQYLSLPELLP